MSNQIQIQRIFDLLEMFISHSELELGMCSSETIATAGTGTYRRNIGSVRPGPYHKEIVQQGKPIVLEDRRYSRLCMKCVGKDVCPYKAFIFHPIIDVEGVNGYICLLSKKKLTEKADQYAGFLANFSNLIRDINQITFRDIASKLLLLSFGEQNGDYKVQFNARGDIVKIDSTTNRKLRGDSAQLSIAANPLLLNGFSDHCVERIAKVTGSGDSGFILNLSSPKVISSRTETKAQKIFSGILSKSKIIEKLKAEAALIAATDSTVLITGETGTGKELFAAAIHESSPRSLQPMISINCSAITDSLVESELFGYVKGAFTGANPEGKKGKFELAHKGTLFLDEIGDMPLPAQAKLLRTLENATVDRIGDSNPIRIDVRVIAATNKDLEKMVKEGAFRQDLYYRLNVMKLDIPPLRERKEDIPLLVEYFLSVFMSRSNKAIAIDQEVITSLLQYDWPGNVRELKNVIEYCVGLESTGFITNSSLPSWFKKNCLQQQADSADQMGILDTTEKGIIKQALNHYGNTTAGKKEAARSLGISLSTLYRKMDTYSL